MSQNVIEQFYTAFQQMESDEMAACYHTDVIFWDPAFGKLVGQQAANMWRMLIHSQQGKEFKIEFDNIKLNEKQGSAEWQAWYTFSKTGRKVHNIINASFEIKDNLIIRHTDQFNLYRWSQQALGLQGSLIGWTPFFQKKLQDQTRSMLRRYEEMQ